MDFSYCHHMIPNGRPHNHRRTIVSRAFLRDDAEGEMPRRNYALPEREQVARRFLR